MTRFLACLLIVASFAAPLRAERVLVFAAASLAGPLDEVTELWEAETGHEVVISYAGSSSLARQIEAGAPADIFLSANPGWMDDLAGKGLIETSSRRNIWTNRLALVSFRPGAGIGIDAEMDLEGMLDGRRLAVALTDAVPAGLYAKAALTQLGLWLSVKDQLAEADNVRAALALVATGAVPYGIVYRTDAHAEPRAHLRGLFPKDSHPPIVYPGAATLDAQSEAHAFLGFLMTEAAQAVFDEAGFQRADPE